MAAKGELLCDEGVSQSPALTPRQSMSEVESTNQAGDGNTFSAHSSTMDQVDSRNQNEQAGATNLKGVNKYT